MGRVIIQKWTEKNPITMIGAEAGVCYGSNTEDHNKNYARGIDCLQSEHGRTWEYPQIYMVLDGYSARVMREFYTHVGGLSTRTQASTRYINYRDFEFVVPDSIALNEDAKAEYLKTMKLIKSGLLALEAYGIPREDSANLLPLGMKTRVVCRMNLRTLIDMTKVRICKRALREFRDLMFDIWFALCGVSGEWEELMRRFYKPKCEYIGYCTEKNSCGRMPKKEQTDELADSSEE